MLVKEYSYEVTHKHTKEQGQVITGVVKHAVPRKNGRKKKNKPYLSRTPDSGILRSLLFNYRVMDQIQVVLHRERTEICH